MANKESKFFTIQEVADYLEVTKQAVSKWINNNELSVFRLPSGRVRIPREEFIRYLKENNFYIDPKISGNSVKKVVVIDDDQSIQKFIDNFFKLRLDLKSEISFADDGVSGLLKIGSIKPHLVILDIEMPGMNGIDVCKKLLQNPELKNLKIIIISGYLENYEDEINQLSVTAAIKKPFDITVMTQVIKDALSND